MIFKGRPYLLYQKNIVKEYPVRKLLYAVNQDLFHTLFHSTDLERINQFCSPVVFTRVENADKDFLLKHSADVEIIVTSWGTAALDAEIMAHAKQLKLLTHAAGSVKPVLSDAVWNAGVRVTSAAAAIAYGVAEFNLGLILTASKRAFWAANGARKGLWSEPLGDFGGAFEIYQQNIGIIGSGHVGRHLIHLLKNFSCHLFLYDPYCSIEQATKLAVTKVETLEELFSQCMIISLNAPSTEETKGMLRGKHFALLKDGALFINTARNALINEPEFIEELKKERFVACLDVTDPIEPCSLDHPYRHLPNVMLTPHEAGVINQNKLRLGTFVANEIEAFVTGKPLYFEVTQENLMRIG